MVGKQPVMQLHKQQMLLSNLVYQRILQVVVKLKTGEMGKHKHALQKPLRLQIHYQHMKKRMVLQELQSLILQKIQVGH